MAGTGDWKAWRIESMADIRSVFPTLGETDFTLNWCFCGTSGVHGSYATIPEIEAEIDKPEPNADTGVGLYEPRITVTLVQPRLVKIASGNIVVTKKDLAYLRELVRRTLRGVAESQRGNT